LSFDYVP